MRIENLSYTKSHSEFIIFLIIFTLAVIVPMFIFKATLEEILIFSSSYVFISAIAVIIYALFGIHKIEFHPDKIKVQFFMNGTKTIPKEKIDKIIVQYQPQSRDIPEHTHFTFYFNEKLALTYFAKRKFSINSNFLNDNARGKEVYKVLSFLNENYPHKVQILDF